MPAWRDLIPNDHHAKFLAGETECCKQEEDEFYRAVEVVDQLRATLLRKRKEYLLNYLEHELAGTNKEN